MTKSVKLTANFLAFPSVNFFENWLSSNHIQFLSNTLYLLISVRANEIYLEIKNDKLQNIGKTVRKTLTFYHVKMSGNIISMKG